jgi:hypothetical protein
MCQCVSRLWPLENLVNLLVDGFFDQEIMDFVRSIFGQFNSSGKTLQCTVSPAELR